MNCQRLVLLGSGWVVPDLAWAHTSIPGIGYFYNGLLHPVLVPAHLLLIIAFGLFVGQQGPKRIELAVVAFAAAVFIGLVLAGFSIGTEMEAVGLVLSAAIGLLVASNPRPGLTWCVLIALLSGLFLGIDSAQDELTGTDKLVTLFGSGVAIYFLVLYPIALADHFSNKPWQKIGIRIVGSWVAASSMLVLALALSSTP